jgi:hypothetical protein
LEIWLHPEAERDWSNRFKTRDWQSASIRISVKDVPKLIGAVVSEVEELKSALLTVGQKADVDIWNQYDLHFLDLNKAKLRRLSRVLSKKSGTKRRSG